MSVGFAVEEASYCSSKKRPAFEAVGVVTDLVVVSVSKTNAASESFVDNGVAEKERIEERRWERMVVFPEPDSPLKKLRHQESSFCDLSPNRCSTYRKTIAWSSARPPSLAQALPARSSASPIALPNFPPSGPFVDDVYVLSDMRAWDDNFATGRETWNLWED